MVALTVPVEGEVSLLYRPAGAEAYDEAYVLPARGAELDLREALREHVVLATPQYPVCREDCKGLCPVCGGDRNRVACQCKSEDRRNEKAPFASMKLKACLHAKHTGPGK